MITPKATIGNKIKNTVLGYLPDTVFYYHRVNVEIRRK